MSFDPYYVDRRTAPIVIIRVEPVGMPGVLLNISSRILHFKYEDCAEKADKVSFTIDNHDLREFDRPLWRTGNKLYLQWGYPEALAPLRTTRIRKVTGFTVLTIEAFGGELALAKETRVRAHSKPGGKVTRSSVARDVAESWGYTDTDKAQWIEETDREYEQLQQVRQTDLEFMYKLAREEHFDFYIDFDGFHFHSKEWLAANTDYTPFKTVTYFSDQSETEVLDIQIENDITVRPGSITGKTWSPRENYGINIIATNKSTTEKAEIAAMLETSGQTEMSIPGVNDVAQHRTIHTGHTSPEDVIADAKNALLRAKSEAVKMKLTITGDPLLLAKRIIEVRGLGSRLSQRYWIRTVEHSITDAYTCEVECISSGSNGHDTSIKTPKGASAIQIEPSNPAYKGPLRDSNGIKIHGVSDEELKQRTLDYEARKAQTDRNQDASAASAVPPDAPEVPAAPTPEQPVRKGPPPVNVPQVDGDDTTGLADPGTAVPQQGGKANEIKTNAGVASQQQLMNAYSSTEFASAPVEDDHTRSYLYSDALRTGDCLQPGNVDLDNRPYVPVVDEEGQTNTATINSMSFAPYEDSTIEVLVPTVSDDGRMMTREEAEDQFYRTGRHLGIYKDVAAADAAGERLHLDQVSNPPSDTLAVRKEVPLTPAQRRAVQ